MCELESHSVRLCPIQSIVQHNTLSMTSHISDSKPTPLERQRGQRAYADSPVHPALFVSHTHPHVRTDKMEHYSSPSIPLALSNHPNSLAAIPVPAARFEAFST